MARQVRSILLKAKQTGVMVKVWRKYEDGSMLGHVLGVGPTFYLLLLIGDDMMSYNGFVACRIQDVTKIEAPYRYRAFAREALRLAQESRPKRPRIDLRSVQSLARTAGKYFPLVTIRRERKDPRVCYIGWVRSVDARWLTLYEIAPGAEWDGTNRYRCSEITRVDFAGGYECALVWVAANRKRKADARIKRRRRSRR